MQAERPDVNSAAPAAMRSVRQVEAYTQQCGLEKSLIVNRRASQIIGGAYCIDIRSTDARRAGETEQRLLNRLAIGFRYQHPTEPAK